jgi:hypothetical protein
MQGLQDSNRVKKCLRARISSNQSAMPRTSTTRFITTDPARRWRGFLGCLLMRIRLERRGFRLRLRLVVEPPAGHRPARVSPVRTAGLPPLPGDHAFAAHCDLRALLDRAPGARRVWPSLALLERVLGSGNADGIHRVEACVLRHAARSLDRLGADSFSPGLVVLRRRVELVLRRKHGDRPSHWAHMPPPAGVEFGAGFGDSVTDFVEIERLQFADGGPVPAGRRARR